MSSKLSDIYNIVITRQTKPTSQQGFSTVLIVGGNSNFSPVRAQFFNSNDLEGIAAVLNSGTSDPEYIAASAVASQSPKVPQVAIGREDIGDTDMTDTLNAIIAETNNFYGVVLVERDVTKQTDAAAWCLANKKLFATCSADANIIDQAVGIDTTSLAYIFNNAGNDRVSIFYKSDAATKFTDAAYLGQVLSYGAGTWTGMAKSLPGEAVDDLTGTQIINALAKKCNIYEEIGEVNVVRDGFVSSGEFTDIIQFVDTLEARIAEDLWTMQVNLKKISYDDEGIVGIQNIISKRLKMFQDTKAITIDNFDPLTKERTGGFEVTVPLSSSVAANDKANRILRNVDFVCWYSGAIHKIDPINGTIVL